MRTRRATWRRRLLRTGLCLLLGAVTTVGVAWGAYRSSPPFNPMERTFILQGPATLECSERKNTWTTGRVVATTCACLDPDELESRITQRRIMAEPATIKGERYEAGEELPVLTQEALNHPNVLVEGAWRQTSLARRMLAGGWGRLPEEDGTVAAQAFGWPARSLWGYSEKPAAGNERLRGYVLITGRRGRLLLLFPTIPVPAGFAIDTLFYAVPWWFLLITPGIVKRWRWRRRGACSACGYDLRGLGEGAAVCPECGT